MSFIAVAALAQTALKLTLLTEAASAHGAVCLDGTPGGYYWRAGVGADAAKFLVIIDCGGWCYGADPAIACAGRANTTLGSSKAWSQWKTADKHGVTTPNCTINPAFCNYSVARGVLRRHLALGQSHGAR